MYDTLNHQIGGFSQQQGMGGSITFTSQFGTVNLASLPVVSRDGHPVMATASPATASLATASPATSPSFASAPSTGSEFEGGIFAAIERLAQLKDKGILTDEEFATKKADLLGRL